MRASWPTETTDLLPRLQEIRHDLHAHPELGFQEHRTQGVVRKWLTDLGLEPRTCARTGLVADLRPDLPGPAVGLRADLDALPMTEETALPYRSVHAGVAHKCGHDGHTAILLGAASRLAARREELTRNVRLLFQPAEEGVDGGGARVMVAEGAAEGLEEIYALHNWPGFPRGRVHVAGGPVMAQTHEFFVELHGKGGHGAHPDHCRDPIVAAAAVITGLQTVVSRGLGHRGGAVVSVCSIHAGEATNVIPGVARLSGTIRTFEEDVTTRVLERFREGVTGIATGHGMRADIRLEPGYPALHNDPDRAQRVREVAEELVGPEQVSEQGLPIAGAEDFAYFTQAVPGAYFLLGAGDASGETPGCHHPDFDFDDDLIPLGIEMFVRLAGLT